MFDVTDKEDITWLVPRLGDQPYKTMTQAVQLTEDKLKSLQRSYIQTTMAPQFLEAAERAKRSGFRYYELFSAGHDSMVTQPAELAKLFLQLV